MNRGSVCLTVVSMGQPVSGLFGFVWPWLSKFNFQLFPQHRTERFFSIIFSIFARKYNNLCLYILSIMGPYKTNLTNSNNIASCIVSSQTFLTVLVPQYVVVAHNKWAFNFDVFGFPLNVLTSSDQNQIFFSRLLCTSI